MSLNNEETPNDLNGFLLQDKAREIFQKSKEPKTFLEEVQKFVVDHAKGISDKTRSNSILESRFTPAIEAFNRGWLSCGSMANIAFEMARSVGYEVKLVHGECAESVDHAWIMVKDHKNEEWKQYDLTRSNLVITPDHKIKMVVNNWEEIRDQIEEDNLTCRKRREDRALQK